MREKTLKRLEKARKLREAWSESTTCGLILAILLTARNTLLMPTVMLLRTKNR